MNATIDHKPEPWFWEAGSDDCPQRLVVAGADR